MPRSLSLQQGHIENWQMARDNSTRLRMARQREGPVMVMLVAMALSPLRMLGRSDVAPPPPLVGWQLIPVETGVRILQWPTADVITPQALPNLDGSVTFELS